MKNISYKYNETTILTYKNKVFMHEIERLHTRRTIFLFNLVS